MAVADRLPHGDDVGRKVLPLKLEGPEVGADTAEAHLDFIGDENATCFMDMSVEGRRTRRQKQSHECNSGHVRDRSSPFQTSAMRFELNSKFSGTYAATCWK